MATEKMATGLPRNTSAALSYVLGPFTGILFLLLEKDPFVRFHAAQSIVVVGGMFVLWVLSSIIFIWSPLPSLIFLTLFILWLTLIYKAWQGDEWVVPVLGKYAKAMMKKSGK